MSREILFRAKSIDNGEWVYGFYVCVDFPNSKHQIVEGFGNMWETHDIDSKTVSQFTGLTDKNGVKIFEGSNIIIGHPCWSEKCYVKFSNGSFIAVQKNGETIVNFNNIARENWTLEVIGNKWDEKIKSEAEG